MKQKIVIRVQMNCDRCRSKAMKTAVGNHGIETVSIEGEERDLLVIIGERVDSVALACSLRKKLHCADILTVEEVKEKEKEKEKEEEKPKEKQEEDKKDVPLPHPVINPSYLPAYCVIFDPEPSTCSIQ
ncbi:heavy metal-associated isoprenylated plant protein 47-like [Musa acuminata AAA Group]|uniref:heavy metal-associated isoprenylated plant protein 47-like n=1 Tax=Musa acuminata AAA Group TaxID=214697 RepID=UPI0031DA3543